MFADRHAAAQGVWLVVIGQGLKFCILSAIGLTYEALALIIARFSQ